MFDALIAVAVPGQHCRLADGAGIGQMGEAVDGLVCKGDWNAEVPD